MADLRFPGHCAALNPSTGKAVLIRVGKRGYYERPDWAQWTPEDVDAYNTIHGIRPEVAEAMLVGSMFGWHVPAAQYPEGSTYQEGEGLSEAHRQHLEQN